MVFVVQFKDIYEDQPERLPERQQHMPAHLAFLAQHPNKVVASGALCDRQPGGHPFGGHLDSQRSRPSNSGSLLSIGPLLDGWPTPLCPRLPLGKSLLVARFHRLHEFLWRHLTKPSKKGRRCR